MPESSKSYILSKTVHSNGGSEVTTQQIYDVTLHYTIVQDLPRKQPPLWPGAFKVVGGIFAWDEWTETSIFVIVTLIPKGSGQLHS